MSAGGLRQDRSRPYSHPSRLFVLYAHTVIAVDIDNGNIDPTE
jgi:hypothetical protein